MTVALLTIKITDTRSLSFSNINKKHIVRSTELDVCETQIYNTRVFSLAKMIKLYRCNNKGVLLPVSPHWASSSSSHTMATSSVHNHNRLFMSQAAHHSEVIYCNVASLQSCYKAVKLNMICSLRGSLAMCTKLWLQKSIHSWPSGKLPIEYQKIAQNLTLFSKNWQKLSLKKKSRFWLFFLHSSGNFLECQLRIPENKTILF